MLQRVDHGEDERGRNPAKFSAARGRRRSEATAWRPPVLGVGVVDVKEEVGFTPVCSAEPTMLHGAPASSFPFTAYPPITKFREEERRERRRWWREKRNPRARVPRARRGGLLKEDKGGYGAELAVGRELPRSSAFHRGG